MHNSQSLHALRIKKTAHTNRYYYFNLSLAYNPITL